MLLEIHLRSKNLSNSSAASGFVWENFDLDSCKDFEEGKYIWAFCTALCFPLGFPASVAIFWEMFKTHRRGTPLTPNLFLIMNLSTMDFLFLVFIPPGLLNHLIWEYWLFEAIWNFVYALNTCGRPLLMACVCLDCYVAVVHPITYCKKKSLTPRVVMVGIVWTLTLASGIAYCVFYRLYFSMFATVPFIISIAIIGFCDSFIVHALIKSDPSRKNIHPQKRRAIQTLINSLVMAVLFYLPPVLLYSIGTILISNLTVFMCIIVYPTNICSSLGSAVMPILYVNSLGKLDHLRLGCCRTS